MLISTCGNCSAGEFILVVEHDEETIRSADHIIDSARRRPRREDNWPGTMKEIRANPASVTGAFLNGRERKSTRGCAPTGNGWSCAGSPPQFKKGLLRFPVGALTCVTGVSGSGNPRW